MRPRTLLILFLVVAGLAAFVALYERKLPGSDERAKQGKKLVDLEKDQVTAVAIEGRAGGAGQDVRLERAGKAPEAKKTTESAEGTAGESPAPTWRMTRPLQAAADGLAVGGLVESLAGLDKERTIEQPDRRALGLDPPRLRVRLKTEQGETVLSFGAKVPTASEVMVAVQGDARAYAVADSVLTTLERDPGEWRDKQIFHGDRDRIDRISLAGPAGETLLARRGDAFWIESPPAARDRADRELVDTLLGDLTALHADRFVDRSVEKKAPAAGDEGLTPPQGTVEAVLRGEAKPFRVELGGPAGASSAPPAAPEPGAPPTPPAPSIYARAGDEVFATAQTGLAAAAGRSPADWRSKSLSGLQVYQVEGAKVTDAAGTLDLSRSGTDWKRGKETISYTPVSDLLFAVTGAKAVRIVSADEARKLGAPLDRPLLAVAMKGEGSAGTETVTFYPAIPAGVPARASGRDAVLLLAADQLASVEKQVAAVRAAPPVAPAKPLKP